MKPSSLLDQALLKDLGVLDWGYTEDPVPRSLAQFETWIREGQHGSLNYLSDHRKDLRSDLRKVFPEFQSALVFLFSYQAAKKWLLDRNEHSVAAYTLGFGGEDYHRALKLRLDQIALSLKLPDLKFFNSLDAQPVMERDLAHRAGLGWFGKNSMLINRQEGSYFIIGSLLLNQKLPLEEGVFDTDHCGQCTACADACPTDAIDLESRTLVAQKCISTYTIEVMKDALAPQGFDESRGEIFGCDICQDVCPWNRKPLGRITGALLLREPFTFLKEWLFEWPKEKLESFMASETNRGLKKKLLGTPFDRPGKAGWLKNLRSHLRSNRSDL